MALMLHKIFFDVADIGCPCYDRPVMLHAALGDVKSVGQPAARSDVKALVAPSKKWKE